MYFLDTATALDSIHDFWVTIAGNIPDDVTIQVEGSGDVIESTTGALTASWAGTQPAAVAGSFPGVYAAPAGAVVDWNTSTIIDGHRVRGKSFIVPLASGAFEGNGSLNPINLAQIQDAASDFVVAQNTSFVIWHRPRAAKPADGSRPAVTARVGGHALVTSAHVPDMVAVLRSRRD